MLSAFDLIWQAVRLASLLGRVVADAFGVGRSYFLGAALLLLAGFTAPETGPTDEP